MKDNPIDVEVVPVEIVRCPRCGARNRLLKQKISVEYRCGGCGLALANPFVEISLVKRCLARNGRLLAVGKYLSAIVVAVLAVGAIMRHQDQSTPNELVSGVGPSLPTPTVNFPRPHPVLEAPAGPPKSLENGTILTDLENVGHGKFTVENDTDRDAVIKLVDEAAGHSVLAVYVTAHSEATIDEIPEGSFAALYGQGVDWDETTHFFKRKKSFAKFKPDLDFHMTLDERNHQITRVYKSITLELAPSVVGNITKTEISEQAFSEF